MKTIHIMRKEDKRFMCPACNTRSLNHGCLEIGIKVVYGTKEDPIEVWEADLYRCDCGEFTVTRFARFPTWTKSKGFHKEITFPNGTPPITQWLQHIKEIADADEPYIRIGIVFVSLTQR